MKAITACVAMLVGVMAASVPSPASGQTEGMALDQANDNLGYYYHNQYSPWQSFTAGTNGHLAAMQAHVYSTDGANWSATLEIRQGEGASGVLLASQTVTGDGVNRLRTFVLATPVRQTAGGLYTFVFSNASTGLTVRASGNSYAGGRCRNHASYDYNFRTWVLASDWSGEAWRDTSFTASSTVISTAAQLAQFAWLVNNGTTFAGQTITLAADIDLGMHYWTPIGGDSAPFNGTFDGAGHSVNGLLIDRPGVSHQGLFGVTDSNSSAVWSAG